MELSDAFFNQTNKQAKKEEQQAGLLNVARRQLKPGDRWALGNMEERVREEEEGGRSDGGEDESYCGPDA